MRKASEATGVSEESIRYTKKNEKSFLKGKNAKVFFLKWCLTVSLEKIPLQLNSRVLKCSCGKTYDFASEGDMNMKFWLHHKVCSKLTEGSKQVRITKKAMTSREQRLNEAERM